MDTQKMPGEAFLDRLERLIRQRQALLMADLDVFLPGPEVDDLGQRYTSQSAAVGHAQRGLARPGQYLALGPIEQAGTLQGLEQALRGQGKDGEADQARTDFEQAWARADIIITSSRF